METSRLVLETAFKSGQVTVVPVVRISFGRWQAGPALSCLGIKSPVAVILQDGASRRVFRTSGEEITFEDLGKEAPEIRAELESLRNI